MSSRMIWSLPGFSTLNALRTDGTQDGGGVYNPGTGGVAGLAPLADPIDAAIARAVLLPSPASISRSLRRRVSRTAAPTTSSLRGSRRNA